MLKLDNSVKIEKKINFIVKENNSTILYEK